MVLRSSTFLLCLWVLQGFIYSWVLLSYMPLCSGLSCLSTGIFIYIWIHFGFYTGLYGSATLAYTIYWTWALTFAPHMHIYDNRQIISRFHRFCLGTILCWDLCRACRLCLHRAGDLSTNNACWVAPPQEGSLQGTLWVLEDRFWIAGTCLPARHICLRASPAGCLPCLPGGLWIYTCITTAPACAPAETLPAWALTACRRLPFLLRACTASCLGTCTCAWNTVAGLPACRVSAIVLTPLRRTRLPRLL